MPGPTGYRRWMRVAICVLVAGLLVGGFGLFVRYWARQAVQEQRASCLRVIGYALRNFNDTYKQLPSPVYRDVTGRPLGSWRYHLMPFVEANMVGVDFSQPWDAPCQRWYAKGHPVFCRVDTEAPHAGETSVLAITGRGTAFDEGHPVDLSRLPGDLVLVIEVARSGFHWMEPGDLDVDAVPESITGGLDGRGVLVLFADGAVWHVSPDVPLEELKKFVTIKGAEHYDRDTILTPYLLHKCRGPYNSPAPRENVAPGTLPE